MKNVNIKAFIGMTVITGFVLWFLLLFLFKIEVGITWAALRTIPSVVTVEFILWLIFASWAWKSHFFQGWLIKVPVLEGKWSGTLQTTWQASNNTTAGPIQVELVVKQSFLRTSCTMRTSEMTSQSFAVEFLEDPDSGIKKLIYTYGSVTKASVRKKSPIHYGTAVLELIDTPSRMLRGKYWTDRRTTGDIDLKYIGEA